MSGFTWLVNHVCAPLIPGFSVWCPVALVPDHPIAERWESAPGTSDDAAAAQVDADAATYRRAAGGDEQAWQELFDRWKKPLLAFFYRSLGSQGDAEDLTLAVFVRLHRSAAAYEPRASFAGYVFHIARNVLLNEVRRRKRKPADLLPAEAFEYLEAPGTASAARLAELEESFQRALAQLPEHQRTLLLLIQQQQLEPSAAAAALGLNANAVRVQLHRARQRLKELMNPSKP